MIIYALLMAAWGVYSWYLFVYPTTTRAVQQPDHTINLTEEPSYTEELIARIDRELESSKENHD